MQVGGHEDRRAALTEPASNQHGVSMTAVGAKEPHSFAERLGWESRTVQHAERVYLRTGWQRQRLWFGTVELQHRIDAGLMQRCRVARFSLPGDPDAIGNPIHGHDHQFDGNRAYSSGRK
jgi:hypothetical protein